MTALQWPETTPEWKRIERTCRTCQQTRPQRHFELVKGRRSKKCKFCVAVAVGKTKNEHRATGHSRAETAARNRDMEQDYFDARDFMGFDKNEALRFVMDGYGVCLRTLERLKLEEKYKEGP